MLSQNLFMKMYKILCATCSYETAINFHDFFYKNPHIFVVSKFGK